MAAPAQGIQYNVTVSQIHIFKDQSSTCREKLETRINANVYLEFVYFYSLNQGLADYTLRPPPVLTGFIGTQSCPLICILSMAVSTLQ